jgi:hypothetical protein
MPNKNLIQTKTAQRKVKDRAQSAISQTTASSSIAAPSQFAALANIQPGAKNRSPAQTRKKPTAWDTHIAW